MEPCGVGQEYSDADEGDWCQLIGRLRRFAFLSKDASLGCRVSKKRCNAIVGPRIVCRRQYVPWQSLVQSWHSCHFLFVTIVPGSTIFASKKNRGGRERMKEISMVPAAVPDVSSSSVCMMMWNGIIIFKLLPALWTNQVRHSRESET
jgi:hypothetical protein